MMSELDEVLTWIGGELPADGVACLLIGGHAVNQYGVLRATQDIDVMIAVEDAPLAWNWMRDKGYTNAAEHENVLFLNRPDSPLRVDFLKVDSETMARLLERSVSHELPNGGKVMLPCLADLLAMKLFALRSGSPRRWEKDFPDVVNLVRENGLDLESDLKGLCLEYGTEEIYEKIRKRLEGGGDA